MSSSPSEHIVSKMAVTSSAWLSGSPSEKSAAWNSGPTMEQEQEVSRRVSNETSGLLCS